MSLFCIALNSGVTPFQANRSLRPKCTITVTLSGPRLRPDAARLSAPLSRLPFKRKRRLLQCNDIPCGWRYRHLLRAAAVDESSQACQHRQLAAEPCFHPAANQSPSRAITADVPMRVHSLRWRATVSRSSSLSNIHTGAIGDECCLALNIQLCRLVLCRLVHQQTKHT